MLPLPLIRRCWWAVAVIAAACHSPNQAVAGCSGHSGTFYSLIEADTPLQPERPAEPAPPAPCQGPNCSGAPVRDGLPVPPVTTVTTEVKDQVRCFAMFDGGEPPPVFDREFSSPRPIRRASSVFHPPRTG